MSSVGDRPSPELRDYVRAGVDIAVSGLPGVGGPVQKLGEAVLVPNLKKRQEAWLDRLNEAVGALEAQVEGFDLESLADNELFATAVLHASRIAFGTHLESQLDMLKQIVFRLGRGDQVEDYLAIRFLQFVDELSPEHFAVLTYASNPSAHHADWPEDEAASGRAMLEDAELGLEPFAIDVLLADLESRALLRKAGLPGVAVGEEALAPFTTPVGDLLVDWVRRWE